MLGTLEDNSPVQVISTPTALVSYFQVLFLDFFKVLQQLCVVDAGGVTFLGLGGSFQTVFSLQQLRVGHTLETVREQLEGTALGQQHEQAIQGPNVCNQNLMKLVTPEDDEPDEPKPVPQKQPEPNCEDSLPKQEGTASGGPGGSCNSSFGSGINVFTSASTDRAPVTLHLDGIVQVLNCHLSDTTIGMMTRIAVLKWLYHLYIKTPRKMFRHTDSLFPILLQTLSDESDEVVLKDLEVLAEIASSPAGQTDDPGAPEGPDLRVNHSELQVPTSGRANLLNPPSTKGLECSPFTPTMNSYFYKFMINLLQTFSSERKLLEARGPFIIRQLCLLLMQRTSSTRWQTSCFRKRTSSLRQPWCTPSIPSCSPPRSSSS